MRCATINMDAAEYKHVVLGLIFLKYISDAFEAKHAELDPEFRQFFTDRSLRAGKLVHREYRDMKATYRVLQKDVGQVDSQALVKRPGMPVDTTIEIEESPIKDKFAFIYRARYRA